MKEKVQRRKAKDQKALGSLHKIFYLLTTQRANALGYFCAAEGQRITRRDKTFLSEQ